MFNMPKAATTPSPHKPRLLCVSCFTFDTESSLTPLSTCVLMVDFLSPGTGLTVSLCFSFLSVSAGALLKMSSRPFRLVAAGAFFILLAALTATEAAFNFPFAAGAGEGADLGALLMGVGADLGDEVAAAPAPSVSCRGFFLFGSSLAGVSMPRFGMVTTIKGRCFIVMRSGYGVMI